MIVDDNKPRICDGCGVGHNTWNDEYGCHRQVMWNKKRNCYWCNWCFYRHRGSDYMQGGSDVGDGYNNTLFEGDDKTMA